MVQYARPYAIVLCIVFTPWINAFAPSFIKGMPFSHTRSIELGPQIPTSIATTSASMRSYSPFIRFQATSNNNKSEDKRKPKSKSRETGNKRESSNPESKKSSSHTRDSATRKSEAPTPKFKDPIPFVDTEHQSYIDCYPYKTTTLNGVKYTLGVPADNCVMLCYFAKHDVPAPIDVHSPRMDEVFSLAARIVSAEYGGDFELQRTAQILTMTGDFDELDDEEDAEEDEDGYSRPSVKHKYLPPEEFDEGWEAADENDLEEMNEEDDDEEGVEGEGEEEEEEEVEEVGMKSTIEDLLDEDGDSEALLGFEHEGVEYLLVRLLNPVLVVGKPDPKTPTRLLLLTQEESTKVMPELSEIVSKAEETLME